MSYFGTIYGGWTDYDSGGDRMRIAAEFRSDEEITADSAYVDLYVVFTGEYDLGAGDPITDSNYTFVTGGYWGAASGMNGNISGTAGADGIFRKVLRTTAKKRIPLKYGENAAVLSITASHSGVEKVGNTGNTFTATLNSEFTLQHRLYHTPNTPSVAGDAKGSEIHMVISGHQLDPKQDRWWEDLDVTIRDHGVWTETHDVGNTNTEFTWNIGVPNSVYLVSARSKQSNRQGVVDVPDDVSAWAGWAYIYTTPAAPSSVQAKRRTSDRTQVDITWTNIAPGAASYEVFRYDTGAGGWVSLGMTTVTSFTETRTYSDTSKYAVTALTPDGQTSVKAESAAIPPGWAVPDAATSVILDYTSDTDIHVTITGNQTNPALDKLWKQLYWQLEIEGVNYPSSGISYPADWVGPGTITSFGLPKYTNIKANSQFRVGVRAWNDAGIGGLGVSEYYYTKPTTPTAPTAERVAGGESVIVTPRPTGKYIGSSKVMRSLDGAAYTVLGVVPKGSTFTDTVAQTHTAQYRTQDITPGPDPAVSDISPPSVVLPVTAEDKDHIVGIDKIFCGTVKVFRVMTQGKQIWLG